MRHCFALLCVLAIASCSRTEPPASDESAEPTAGAEQTAEPTEAETPPTPVVAESDEVPTEEPAVPAEPAGEPSAEPNAPEVGAAPAAPLGAESCAGELNRALMAREIVDREPAGTAGPFSANGEPLYLFAEFNNATDADRIYTIRWHHDGTPDVFTQTMTAGISPSWRTWARHRIAERQTGEWRLEVVSPEGCIAGTVAFQAE